ncbi:receptor-like protein kinase HSL1 [Salvia divinorum]|uniref:Receptor-like protein kinase HSL1 n=1 Tax=Salvia divinorum TaxID=28513 RepID=A0ABD1HF17_SALDI
MHASSNNMTKNGISSIIIILLLSLPFHGNSQNNDPKQEKDILLGLKQQWSSPPSLSHWTPSSDHCTWPEITCTSGSVTGLVIINGTIMEAIPVSICDLSNLSRIDLQLNYIPGHFPTVLYNCSKLEYLDLSNNYFIGSLPDDINRLSPQLLELVGQQLHRPHPCSDRETAKSQGSSAGGKLIQWLISASYRRPLESGGAVSEL